MDVDVDVDMGVELCCRCVWYCNWNPIERRIRATDAKVFVVPVESIVVALLQNQLPLLVVLFCHSSEHWIGIQH